MRRKQHSLSVLPVCMRVRVCACMCARVCVSVCELILVFRDAYLIVNIINDVDTRVCVCVCVPIKADRDLSVNIARHHLASEVCVCVWGGGTSKSRLASHLADAYD